MAIVPDSFRLLPAGGGSNEVTDGKAAYTKTWECDVDDPLDEADVILSANDCPKVGDNLVTTAAIYPYSWAKRVTADRSPTVDTHWTVRIRYDNQKPHDADLEPNPILKPARIWWSFRKEEIILPYDRAGKWFKNAAGDFLASPPSIPVTLSILNVSKNVASYSPVALAAVHDAVNTDGFLGFLPGYCKVASVEPGEPQQWNQWQFSELVTQIECSPIPFHPHYELNRGPRYLMTNTFTGLDFPVVSNTDGVYSDAQTLLDADGHQLAAGATPTVEEFTRFPLIPFFSLAHLVGLVVSP
jgi:hypothetical protein